MANVTHDLPWESGPRIEPLALEDLYRLPMGWGTRLDREQIGSILRDHPGLTLWAPESGEYVVGGPWRHRTEIVAVVELAAIRSAAHLLDALADAALAQQCHVVIAPEHHESRRQEFYTSAGYELLEEIMIYELSRLRRVAPVTSPLRFERVQVGDPEARAALLALDHATFPWLWWNSPEELDHYEVSPGVEIYLGRDEAGEVISYVGLTRFRSWGHLDRIAVALDRQGQGFGLASLDWAVRHLMRSGARRIGLSTQVRNERSRQLYERYGFHRVPSQDYRLYGRWLRPPEETTPLAPQ